ncbi:MAG: hypothetical protein DYG89_24490 [Caldilinea sp. CFX5]|nr:hypothetical protein [Caldilinea sp. CFX5]
MKQWQTVRWLLPTLIIILLVVAACTGIADDRSANTRTTPAFIFSPTPGTDGDAAQAGTPDLLVVVVTPTPAEQEEAADASADEGVTASEEGASEGAAHGEGTANEAGATAAAPDAASGEATNEGDQANAAPAALAMSETELISTGEQVYTQECASCHQLNGAGTSSYPALNNNAVVTDEEPTAVISTILLGRGEMPAFADTLSPEQIAAVASYIRNAWDNNAAVVMPAQVNQVADGGSAAATADDTTTADASAEDAAEEPAAQDAATEGAGVEDAGAENGVTAAEEGAAAQNTPAATAPLTETATMTATTAATPVPATAAPTGTAAMTTTATATATLPTAAGVTWTPAPIMTVTMAAPSVVTGTPTAPTAPGNATPQAQATPAATGEAPQASSADAEQLISMGEEIYAQECASCHQLNGEGTSSYPALNNNELVTSEDPSAPLTVILHGRGEMPAFADTLSAEEIAAVLSYVRSAWDNSAASVTVEQVTQEGAPADDTGDDSTVPQNESAAQAAATPAATGTMTTTATPEGDAAGDEAAISATPAATGTMTTTATPEAEAAGNAADTTSTPAPDDPNQAEDEAAGAEDSVQSSEEQEATEAGVPRQAESVVEPPEEDNMTAMDEAAEEATPVSPEELISMGESLYTLNCAACHQAEGRGVANAYPPLAGNAFVNTEDPTPVIQVIITGRAGMPRFSADLSAREIAAIVSYVRNAWGNEAAAVSPDQVRSVRESVSDGAESGGH